MDSLTGINLDFAILGLSALGYPALRGQPSGGIARNLNDKVSQPLGLTSLVFGQAWRGVEMLYCKRGSFQRKICFLLYMLITLLWSETKRAAQHFIV